MSNEKNSNAKNYDFFSFADKLPGHFFINSIQGQIIYHNQAVTHFAKDYLNIQSVVGMDNLAIALTLDPNHENMARRSAKRIKMNIDQMLIEKQALIFDERSAFEGNPLDFVCYRAPLFDPNGQLIGHLGYAHMIDIHSQYSGPDPNKDLHIFFKALLEEASSKQRKTSQHSIEALKDTLALLQAQEKAFAATLRDDHE